MKVIKAVRIFLWSMVILSIIVLLIKDVDNRNKLKIKRMKEYQSTYIITEEDTEKLRNYIINELNIKN